ncbi:MAG: glycosyltransferase family 4 protein [Alcanivorax jadensis]|uniref:glycosyltransferase family 4 protein n=1 Tax=Alcanivorax jadensis TaxID=64988 RepID=UPI00300137D5
MKVVDLSFQIKYMNQKVFLLVASFPDSIIQFRGELIKSLLDSGCKVHIAVPSLEPDSEISRKLNSLGVVVHDIPLHRTGINPVRDLHVLFILYKLISKINAEYVFGYTVKPVIYGTLASWVARIPNRFALITGLGYAFTGEPTGPRRLLRRFIQSLYRFSLSRADKVFFQNPDDESLFRELGLLKQSVPSCIVNGSGVDVSEYQVSQLPSQPVFLLIARLLGDKGVREYAAAAMEVRSSYPNARFLLVGWIDDNPDAISQSELDGWVEDGVIEYLGKLSDVRPAISKSSIYVLPSYREGTPRTVLEAMAMGRAIITTDAPGCRETVVDADNGFLVPVQNVSALVDAMVKMVLSPETVASMGRRSRLIAEEKYDVHNVNAVMLREMGL